MSIYEADGQVIVFFVAGLGFSFLVYFLLSVGIGTIHFLSSRFFDGQHLLDKAINKLICKTKE